MGSGLSMNVQVFSPRTWRCFPFIIWFYSCYEVFSTHVEVFLLLSVIIISNSGFLHARGGVSAFFMSSPPVTWFSPRTWRCFSIKKAVGQLANVFSTHVEVFPGSEKATSTKSGFLHARGGVSCPQLRMYMTIVFSPRTWRCFSRESKSSSCSSVFSTHVEVFLVTAKVGREGVCFLHARGGVSYIGKICKLHFPFSPRTWRCFLKSTATNGQGTVFSTHVEVFLI